MSESENATQDVAPVGKSALHSERTALSSKETCREVERMVAQKQEDRVKCVHLFGSYYRCNWWSRLVVNRVAADYDWSALLTDQIRKSAFLKVTAEGDRLTIEELPEPTTNKQLLRT